MPRRYYSSTAQRTSLAAPLSNSATTMIVASTAGFPATRPYTLVVDPDTINEEIVTVTAASGTTLTVIRGEDGATAVAHDLGAIVWHGFTGRDLGEPQAHMDSNNAVHGVTGSVVGTSDTQTLTNKSMSGSDNTFSNIPQSAVTGLVGDLAAKAPINNPTLTGNVTLPTTTTLGDLSPTEISYLNGVTSNVQDQLDSKAPKNNPTFTGTVSLPGTTGIGAVTSAEISRLAGVTANIQSQIDGITGGGVAVPPGGETGWILVKKSGADYDMEWRPFSDLAYVPGVSGDYVVPDGAITGGDSTGTYSSGSFTWRWHKFTTTGTVLQLSVSQPVIGDILIVGGGGGGGASSLSYSGGGGGAGSLYSGPYAFGTGLHNCAIGAGGIFGGTGGNTYFDDIWAFGGGAGNGGNGGSGGGGFGASGAGGTRTGGSLDGNVTTTLSAFNCANGGDGNGGSGQGGAGGGASFVSSIDGTSRTYAVGGGVATGAGTNGLGNGGGGANMGVAGGGGGGAGGNGVVVVRYRIA